MYIQSQKQKKQVSVLGYLLFVPPDSLSIGSCLAGRKILFATTRGTLGPLAFKVVQTIGRVRSGYIFPWFPTRKVTLAWLCLLTKGHCSSQDGFLYLLLLFHVLITSFSLIPFGLQVATGLSLVFIIYCIISYIFTNIP